MIVDFPLPEEPTNATVLPLEACILTPFKMAVVGEKGYEK
jgi:hypothetical protein